MANYVTTFGELRGSVGGVTFSRNAGGIYCKMRAVPIQPGTAPQGFQQNILGSLASGWSTVLDQTQRDAWAFFANQHPVPNKVGQMIKLSGISMYVRLNARMLTAGLVAFLGPPTNLQVRGVSVAEVVSAATDATDATVKIEPVMTADEYVYVFMAANVGPGVSNVNNKLVFSAAVVGDAVETDFVVPVPAKFGALIDGNNVHVTIQRLNSLTGGLTPAIPAVKDIS